MLSAQGMFFLDLPQIGQLTGHHPKNLVPCSSSVNQLCKERTKIKIQKRTNCAKEAVEETILKKHARENKGEDIMIKDETNKNK